MSEVFKPLGESMRDVMPRTLFMCLHQGEIFDAMYDLIDRGYDEEWVNGPGQRSIIDSLAMRNQVSLIED